MSDRPDILDYKFESMDFSRKVTIRQYFKVLLTALWREGEGFSGKHPFGNSGWQAEIYIALIKGGYIEGTLDSDGYIEKLDRKKADKFVVEQIIDRLF